MQSRPRIEPGLSTELQPISVLSPTIAPNFERPVSTHSGSSPRVACFDANGLPVQSHIGANDSCAQMSLVAEDGIAYVVEMRDFAIIEE